MYEQFDIWTFLLGLPLGLLIAGIVWWINHRIGKRERRFDERYQSMHRRARSYSWFATTTAILIGWMLSMMIEGPGLAFFILSGIWVIHMMSYAIGASVASKYY